MKLGVYSFGDLHHESATGYQPVAEQLAQTLERIRLAEEVGLSFYGLGEHHLDRYAISNPATVLAAAAVLTKDIVLSSAVSVLSTDDPVRLYQQFTTVDQLSHGRAELLAGRGSFTESFGLFGADLSDYDELFDEKLDLLVRIDKENPVTWSGRFRPPLQDAHVYPRPYGPNLRISVGTGGNPRSSLRAGEAGLPIAYAIIGGLPERFAPLVELYRKAGAAAGHPPGKLEVTMSAIGLIASRSQDAKEVFYPYWNQVMEYGAEARGWRVPTRMEYNDYVRRARTIFAGSPAEVADRMITVGQLVGADRYAMQMDWAGVPHIHVMKAIELLGTEVLPDVRREFQSSAVLR